MEYGYNISRLKRARAEQGLTVCDLAAKCEITQETVTRVLRGGPCRPPTVKKIAEAMGLNLADLVIPLEDSDRLETPADSPARPRGDTPYRRSRRTATAHGKERTI